MLDDVGLGLTGPEGHVPTNPPFINGTTLLNDFHNSTQLFLSVIVSFSSRDPGDHIRTPTAGPTSRPTEPRFPAGHPDRSATGEDGAGKSHNNKARNSMGESMRPKQSNSLHV